MNIECQICGEINCEKNCSWLDLDVNFSEEEIKDWEDSHWDIFPQNNSPNFNWRTDGLFR